MGNGMGNGAMWLSKRPGCVYSSPYSVALKTMQLLQLLTYRYKIELNSSSMHAQILKASPPCTPKELKATFGVVVPTVTHDQDPTNGN